MNFQCSLRDRNCCVLTHADKVVDVAHIYSFSMSKILKDDFFWTYLNFFWFKDSVEKWKMAVFTEQKTEVCENLITLVPSVHGYWGAVLFALKPLNMILDEKSLDVQFFWLCQYKRRPLVLLITPPELPSDL